MINNVMSCLATPKEKEIWDNHPEDLSFYLKYRRWWFEHPLEPIFLALGFISLSLGIGALVVVFG